MQGRFPFIRRAVLLLGDTLLILAGLFAAIIVNDSFKQLPQLGITAYYTLIPVIVVSAWILLTANGLLSIVRMGASQVVISVGVAVFQLLLISMAASFLFSEVYSRTVILMAAFFQFVFLSVGKYVFWRIERGRLKPKNVLVIGSDQYSCSRVVTRLSCQPFSHFCVRCYSLSDSSDERTWQEEADRAELMILAADVSIDIKSTLVQYGHERGKQVALIPDFYELFCLNTEIDKYDDIPVFRAKYLKPTLETRIMKRGLDIAVSALALGVLWPIFLLVYIAIKLDSPGPVLYRQVRTGEDEKEFVIYKFRSMRQNAEKLTGPVLAAENDPRITGVGHILRATRLDELPQLFNVFRGEMSIVGPRPERPVFVAEYKEAIPNYHYRHNVKPGITGLAQVYGKYNTQPQDKLVYDLIYIQRCSVLTDLTIMLQTVRILLIKDSTEGVTVPEQQAMAYGSAGKER